MQTKKFIPKMSAAVLAGLMGINTLMPGISAAAEQTGETLYVDSNVKMTVKTGVKDLDGKTVTTLKATKYGIKGEKVRIEDKTNGADNIVGFYINSQDNWGLCLRPSVTSGAGEGVGGASKSKTNYWVNMPNKLRYAMSLAMFYGYPNAVSNPERDADDPTAKAYFKATQLVIWELALGYRKLDQDDGTNKKLYDIYDSEDVGGNLKSYSLIKYYNYDTAIKDAYYDIVNKMKAHRDIPSNMWATKKQASNADKFDKSKSILMYYSFDHQNYRGSYTVQDAKNSKQLDWKDNTFAAIKKLGDSWNTNDYYGKANTKYDISGNKITITADNPPFEPGTIQTTDMIEEKIIGKQGDGWVIYAIDNDHQDIAFENDTIDPTKAVISVATPNYGNVKIFKEFHKKNDTEESETLAKQYISKVSFTLETTHNSEKYYVVAEKTADGNNWKFKGTTKDASKATKITLDSTTFDKEKRFNTIVYDLPASDKNARKYTVREYAPEQGNYPAVDGEAVGTVTVNKYNASSPTTDASADASARTLFVENTENSTFVPISLKKNFISDELYEEETEESFVDILSANFVACVYNEKDNKVYFLKNLTGSSGKYTLPSEACDLQKGTFASDAVDKKYLTTDIWSAQRLNLSSLDAQLTIKHMPRGTKFGFVEISAAQVNSSPGYGVSDEVFNNKIDINDLANAFKNATGETDGVITGCSSSENPSGNPLPITFGAKSRTGNSMATVSEGIDNYPYFVRLSIKKKSSNEKPLSGATFKLYKDGMEIDEATSGNDGVIRFENYKFYDTFVDSSDGYTFKETKAPDGYLLDETEYKVGISIPISGQMGSGGVRSIDLGYVNQDIQNAYEIPDCPVDIVNYPYKGKITLDKTETLNGTKVPGVEFAFTANKDLTKEEVEAIKVNKGTEISRASDKVSAGDVIITVATDSNGNISIDNLPIGKLDGNHQFEYVYTAEETNIGKGLIGKGPYAFEFYDNGNEAKIVEGVAVITSSVDAYNQPVPVALTVNKKDNHDKAVAGVSFDVTAAEEVAINGQKIYDKGEVIGTITTDSNGVARNYTEVGERGSKNYAFNLYGGFSYNIVEKSVPKGIVLDSTPHNFTHPSIIMI